MPTNRQFSMALQALKELKTETATSQAVPATPALRDVLMEIGQLPRESLFLGIASDHLPVLLNLNDPHPGPMLVAADAGSGKTAFLQTLAQTMVQTHESSDVQYAVITNYPEEWETNESTSHRLGILSVGNNETGELVQALTAWAHANRDAHQCVLLLVDDLESVASLDPETVQNFRWLLLRGPSRRVWPIVTLNAPRYGQVLAWLQNFRTRVFGRIANPVVAAAIAGDNQSLLGQLESPHQFALREKKNWLRFWLPSC